MNDNGNNKGAAAERLDIHNSEIPEVCAACEARHGGICAALDPQQLLALSKALNAELAEMRRFNSMALA